MKLLKNLNVSKKNQLRKYIFAYIVAILFCLLAVFVFFGNLNNIWRGFQAKDELEVDQRAEYKKVVDLEKKQSFKRTAAQHTGGDILVWGNDNQSAQLVSMQLENMKEGYQVKKDLADCAGAEILFVCNIYFGREEVEQLQRYSEEGTTLFFTRIPSEQALKDISFKNLLGIKDYKGFERKTGIRLTQKLLFGEMTESTESFSMKAVTLTPHTEVYGSALEKEDVKSENLSPVFWRYKKDSKSGNVYVADKQLMDGPMGYGVISFLFADLYQVYMYPVINAYCFIVSGMPYVEEYSSEFLYKEYERDSMGVQNDIFFPEFNRCEERYEVKGTWYSSSKKGLGKSGDIMLQYYLGGIEEKKNEIGTLSQHNGSKTVKSPFDNQVVPWTTKFRWTENTDSGVNIPYNVIKNEEYENVIFDDLGLCKGVGFNAVYTDVEPFLKEPDSKDDDDWVNYCRSLETVLGVEKDKMSWLKRTTVGEAIYRIKTFTMMEPEIEYSDSRIDVEIDNFTGKAYFYLSLPKEIRKVENAEATKLYEDFYMIEATEEQVSIVYEEKKR